MADRIHTETTPNGVTVVALGAEYENLNEPVLAELEASLLETADSIDPPLLVLDLSHTRFFGSAFLEVLFRVWTRLKKRDGGRFALSGLTDYCAEVVETTHLDDVWPIAPDRQAAAQLLTEDA